MPQVLEKQGLFTQWVFLKISRLFLYIQYSPYQSSVCCLQRILKRNRNLVLRFHAKDEEKNIYGSLCFLLNNLAAQKAAMYGGGYRLGLSRSNLGILSELKASDLGEQTMVSFQNFSPPSCLQGSLLGHYMFPDDFFFLLPSFH